MLMTSILTGVLCFEIFLWDASLAEWIDMPQFSDDKKIYRRPSPKQDDFYKFTRKGVTDQFPHEYQSIISIISTTEQAVINKSSGYMSHEFQKFDEPEINEYSTEENTFTSSTEEYKTTTKDSRSEENLNEPSFLNDTDILRYLPVDILKTVHRTLKSQPTSSEGKILFLKTFEKTLTTEIESRLMETVAVNRQKRGTEHHDHYGHDSHDSHDHATGFPSIEGALMAISFLTFAVYLIRLVMLLFRNMNNSTPTTGPTVFLGGRRRKSINELDETTAKIFGGVESFSSNFE